MGRSIIITDINGIIIGSPAKERIGDFHPPSIPCIKYKKMSFDDAEAAKKLGVWYPGSTVPLFYNGRVIGTAVQALFCLCILYCSLQAVSLSAEWKIYRC